MGISHAGPEVWPSVRGDNNGSNNGSPNDRSQFLYYINNNNNNNNKNACGFARDKEGHHMNLAVVPSGHTKGL